MRSGVSSGARRGGGKRGEKDLVMSSGRPSVDDCEHYACKSKINLFKQLNTQTNQTKENTSDQEEEGRNKETRTRTRTESPAVDASAFLCPLDREALGRATWSLLHTVAAYYPSSPSEEERAKAEGLVQSLAHFYPCLDCREDFKEEIKKAPPRLSSRRSFSIWVCEQHNAVNAKLGKPSFQCNIEKLDERWKTGSDACRRIVGDDESSPSQSLGQE